MHEVDTLELSFKKTPKCVAEGRVDIGVEHVVVRDKVDRRLSPRFAESSLGLERFLPALANSERSLHGPLMRS